MTLPPNTLVGRLGIGPGPAQAIPFATFTSHIGIRQGMTADKTFYVTPTGTAGNDCTTVAKACTGQRAYDVIRYYWDLNGYRATISIAAGTYTMSSGTTFISMWGPLVGAARSGTQGTALVIAGAGPGSVTINTTDANVFACDQFCSVAVSGFTANITNSGACPGNQCNVLIADGGGQAAISNVVANGTNAFHVLQANSLSVISCSGALTVGGSWINLASATSSSFISCNQSITLTSTPSFTATVDSKQQAYIQICATWTGSATGVRYYITEGGNISVCGGTIPGNSAGLNIAGWYDGLSSSRQPLTGATTYYVRTDGNDNCNGLANVGGSSGACAFATPQKAIDTGLGLDCNNNTLTFQIGTGTAFAGITVNYAFVGNCNTTNPGQGPILQGDAASTTAVAIAGVINQGGGPITVQNIQLKANSFGNSIDSLYSGSKVFVSGISWPALTGSGSHMNSSRQAFINATGSSTILGAVNCHANGQNNGQVRLASYTLVYGADLAWGVAGGFACSTVAGSVQAVGVTHTTAGHTITGPRCAATLNGVVNASGGTGAWPGSLGSATGTGGQCN